jgi:hypothetical protein
MKRRFLFIMALLTAFSGAGVAANHLPRIRPITDGGPIVRFEQNAVVISAFARGARIDIVGTSLSDTPFDLRIERVSATLRDEDHTSEMRLSLPGGVPKRGVWLVVESSTGGYTIAAPSGFPLRQFDLAPTELTSAPGALRQVNIARDHIDVFTVRKGIGVWRADVKDGSASDDDHASNGRVTMSFERMSPLDGAPPASTVLTPGDVVMGVDHNSLEFFVVKVGHP